MKKNEYPIELRSDDVQDVMGNVPPKILHWGTTVISIVVLILLVGCFIFKYPDVVTGNVILTTEAPAQIVGSVYLTAKGLGKVEKGQRVNVRLHAYPDQEFGWLEGVVERVENAPDANGFYVVKVLFPKGLVTNYGKSLPASLQLEGTAEIITEDLRLIVRFFNPLKKILKKYT
jgi:hypothetical protein